MSFAHTDAAGHVHMVDVSAKAPSLRQARARAFVACSAPILRALRDDATPKGDVWATVRLAGIQAAKAASSLLPLAHPIRLTHVAVNAALTDGGVALEASVRTLERTGVEMEALTAVTVAGLTLVDMVKGIDRDVQITRARVVSKAGGRSGSWVRPGGGLDGDAAEHLGAAPRGLVRDEDAVPAADAAPAAGLPPRAAHTSPTHAAQEGEDVDR